MQVFDWKVYYFWIFFLQNLVIRVLLHLLMELFSFLLDWLNHFNLWFYVLVKVLFSYILISVFLFVNNTYSSTSLGIKSFRLSGRRLAIFLPIKNFIVNSYHFQLLIINWFNQVLIVKKRSLNYLLYFGIFMIDMTPIQFTMDCLLLFLEELHFDIIFNCHLSDYFNWLIHPFNFKILVLDSEFVDVINERKSAAKLLHDSKFLQAKLVT